MATWHLEPTAETTHGVFSRDIPPVLTIDSGDTVICRTLDAGWGLEPKVQGHGLDKSRKLEPLHPAGREGHCLLGPIAIRGAEPGMTLEIAIEEVVPGTWGWTNAGGWSHDVHERLGFTGEETFHAWTLDRERMIGTNQHGHQVALRPFMGVMGMPPAAPGEHPTVPPRATGGNLDCKELVPGTTLFLPIEVPLGLFSVGDGHAAQGDGEICVTAIECPMDSVRLTFRLREGWRISAPFARTPDSWIAFGLHEDLKEASYRAIEGMLELMVREYGLSRRDAFALASMVVDLRITQLVNEVRGVHAVLRCKDLNVPK